MPDVSVVTDIAGQMDVTTVGGLLVVILVVMFIFFKQSQKGNADRACVGEENNRKVLEMIINFALKMSGKDKE